ncbi:MAG: hypothetical protein ABSE72_03195 [Bacteroidales bacterium]|jgi:hypothetical protein
MNIKEIEELLEKFYEGGTTAAEEQQLRDFFTREAVPPYLAVHADIFRYYKEAGKEELPDPEFENRLLEEIDETPIIPMYSRRRQFFVLTGIAATILLLIGIVFTFRNDLFLRSTKRSANTEIAFQQAKNALAMVSANFNTGLDQVQKLGNFQRGLNEVQKLQAFQKGIDQMNKFSKFYQYQQIIINPGDQPRP